MKTELLNREVGGWLVLDYVNCGKSALVMRCRRDEKIAALKIFDPDLVERFGRATQLARIQRECSLVGKNHPNLISIYDGGECLVTGYLYVAMEFVEAPNLASSLAMLPRDRIRSVISDVAAAAEYLEVLGLAHRDIKPENVVITEGWARTILLDLGVLRPISGSDLTDETNKKPFIGTLRYAAPEHLLREHADSPESWRAVTFYQLGAVLHDLIMRRPLFSDYSEPFGRLVQTILHATPVVDAPDVDPELISLARDCLVKAPQHRLRFVNWERFQFRPVLANAADARQKLAKRHAAAVTEPPQEMTERERQILRRDLTNQVVAMVRQLCVSNSDLPPIEVHGSTTDVGATCEAIFPATESYGLRQTVRVTLILQVVDYGDSSVQIVLEAGAGTPTVDRVSARLFEGVLELGRLRTALDEALCKVIVRAQDAFEADCHDFVIEVDAGAGG